MLSTKYGYIFVVCVIAGTVLAFVPGAGIFGIPLTKYGMNGLLVDQQIEKGRIEYERERMLMADRDRYLLAEHERMMQRLRLMRPAQPEEGY
jgi:hypothetical protein